MSEKYLSSAFYFISIILGDLLLGIFINNNFYLISNNEYVSNNIGIVYDAPNIICYNSNSFLQTNYCKGLHKFCSFKPLYHFKRACLKALGNFNFW